jgi:hypothetical protein
MPRCSRGAHRRARAATQSHSAGPLCRRADFEDAVAGVQTPEDHTCRSSSAATRRPGPTRAISWPSGLWVAEEADGGVGVFVIRVGVARHTVVTPPSLPQKLPAPEAPVSKALGAAFCVLSSTEVLSKMCLHRRLGEQRPNLVLTLVPAPPHRPVRRPREAREPFPGLLSGPVTRPANDNSVGWSICAYVVGRRRAGREESCAEGSAAGAPVPDPTGRSPPCQRCQPSWCERSAFQPARFGVPRWWPTRLSAGEGSVAHRIAARKARQSRIDPTRLRVKRAP